MTRQQLALHLQPPDQNFVCCAGAALRAVPQAVSLRRCRDDVHVSMCAMHRGAQHFDIYARTALCAVRQAVSLPGHLLATENCFQLLLPFLPVNHTSPFLLWQLLLRCRCSCYCASGMTLTYDVGIHSCLSMLHSQCGTAKGCGCACLKYSVPVAVC